MSELKNISPLLDGFSVGNPISEHHGIVCCPAIKENTDRKFILKVISIPAAQAQLDALLMAGAYKDPADAMEYYRRIGEDVLAEAELLKKLSRLEGFLSYEGWQMEPITRRRLGYQIYLVGSYKRTLEKYIRKNAVTHLEALNLGLDLCAALSVCRQAGYLYVALKPGNIFVSDKKEYRIGDIGFLNLNAMRYASLSERFHSPYTPPELLDPMSPMNLTADTYAVGMILYQLYNDGQLPAAVSEGEPFPMPIHADYEMAEIIMKAIHPDPARRWDDPAELGKVLAAYMQRNSVNDIPITPFIPLDVKPEDMVAVSEETAAPDLASEADSETVQDAPEETETAPPLREIPEDQTEAELSEEMPESVAEDSLSEQECPEEEPAQEAVPQEEQAPDVSEVVTQDDSATDDTSSEEPPVCPEEPAPTQDHADYSDFGLSEEVTRIISRADDLIAYEIPEEIVYHDDSEQEDPFAFATEEQEDADLSGYEEDLPKEADVPDKKTGKKKKAKSYADRSLRKKVAKFFGRLFALILLCGLCAGGYWYYENVYLQTIDRISVEGTQDQITVYIDTKIEESSLVVTCSDNYGKVHTGALTGGKVTFSGLLPSTMYTIEVHSNGFHKLNGKTGDVFTTAATTQILSFTAVAGSEDGSVMLNFTVDGEDPDFWNIRYTAEGEDVRRETITTHSAMITGLTVGKVYTFRLDGGTNFELSGETSVEFLASRLILAEDILITSENGSDITVSWKTPGDVVVNSWNVRCYNKDGLDAQKTVTENLAQFTGIDPAETYTLEITAEGMIQPAKTVITADPISITQFHIDESKWKEMKITWDYTGTDPENGWILTYTVDGGGRQAMKCSKASASIPNFIPDADYKFTVHSADDRSIYNNFHLHRTKVAENFAEYNIKPENLQVKLLKTPSEEKWYSEEIATENFTNTFAPGESVSIALRSANDFYLPGYETHIMYVFRSSYGSVLPDLVSVEKLSWKQIWFGGDHMSGELLIPKTPTAPGEYILQLYFDGKIAKSVEYIVSK